jgi:transcriptional regulator with XRE-family HTH domain
MEAFDLKNFREKHTKLSQREFASKIGVSQGTVGKIEAGYNAVSNKLLDKIAAKFDIDTEPYKSYNLDKGLAHDEHKIEIGEFEYKYYRLLEEKEALHNKLLELSGENNDLLKKIVACTEEKNELLIEREQLNKRIEMMDK